VGTPRVIPCGCFIYLTRLVDYSSISDIELNVQGTQTRETREKMISTNSENWRCPFGVHLPAREAAKEEQGGPTADASLHSITSRCKLISLLILSVREPPYISDTVFTQLLFLAAASCSRSCPPLIVRTSFHYCILCCPSLFLATAILHVYSTDKSPNNRGGGCSTTLSGMLRQLQQL